MAGKGKPIHTPLVAVSALSAAALVLAGCSDSGSSGGEGASAPASSSSSSKPSPSVTPADDPQDQRSESDYPRFSAGANTTEGFAQNVHGEFVKQWVKTGKTDVTVTASSPSTGSTYDMSCSGKETVHCTGGNDAHVYIYGKDVAGGGGGTTEAQGAGGGTVAPGHHRFSGTIRSMTMQQFVSTYDPSYPNPVSPGENLVFLQLDSPETVTANRASGGHDTRETEEVELDYNHGPLRSQYAGRDGEHVTIDVPLSQCWWPSDTRPPLGALGCEVG